MNTALRISDALYRQAKAEAARRGITITAFIEQGLKLNLEQANATKEVKLATFGGSGFALTAQQVREMNGDEKILEQLGKPRR
jgi:hypothetical protein